MTKTYVQIEKNVRERLEIPRTHNDILFQGIARLASISTPDSIRERRELGEVVESFGFIGLPARLYRFTPTFLMDSVYEVLISNFELRGFRMTRDFLPTQDSGTGMGFGNSKTKYFVVEKGEEKYRVEVSYQDLPHPAGSRIRTIGVDVRKIAKQIS